MAVRRCLSTVAELKEARTIKFHYREGGSGIDREGFLAWHNDQVVCYQNTCRHIPITLDYGDGRFYNAPGTHFVCQTHGATYEPLTGLCVAGPCTGASLKRLGVTISDDAIWFEEQEEASANE